MVGGSLIFYIDLGVNRCVSNPKTAKGKTSPRGVDCCSALLHEV